MTSTHDRDAFEAQVRRHARELHVHCYRMLGSFEESEDLVQETFLRAWRKREQFAGRSTLRAWHASWPHKKITLPVRCPQVSRSILAERAF